MSPAQTIYACELRDCLPGSSDRYIMREEWILNQKKQEVACRKRFSLGLERWSRGCRELEPLIPGQIVQVQNQHGPKARKWELSGTVTEVLGPTTYLVKMDGSGRVTRRARQYLRRISPVSEEIDPSRLCSDDIQLNSENDDLRSSKRNRNYCGGVPGSTPNS